MRGRRRQRTLGGIVQHPTFATRGYPGPLLCRCLWPDFGNTRPNADFLYYGFAVFGRGIMRRVGRNDDCSSRLQRLQLGLVKFSARSCVIRSQNNRDNALVRVGVGANVPPARYFTNMAYIPLAVGLPAITAAVTSGNGVGFHFNVSRGMIVGAAASWAAELPDIAVDMRQATETATSIVRYAMASSSRMMLSNLPSKKMIQVLHSLQDECSAGHHRPAGF